MIKKTSLLGLWILTTLTAAAITIKIGSVAPARSPWDIALKKMNKEWVRITKGQVQLKIYPGEIAGNEGDVIRKMRIGILGGGVFTSIGLSKIYPDINLLNVPFLITSQEKLDYALKWLKPVFEEGLEEKGFKILAWSMAGWIHIFSKEPVLYPRDLKKHKLSFSTGEPLWEQAWKKSGYRVIPNDLKDMMMALQSGMVDSFYLTPLVTASAQYFAFAPNMCSLKIAPVVGGIVVTKRVWDRIPDPYKPQMMQVMKDIEAELNLEREKLTREAIQTMKENGMVINQAPEDSLAKWTAEAAKGLDEVIGKAFSEKLYREFLDYLKGFESAGDER